MVNARPPGVMEKTGYLSVSNGGDRNEGHVEAVKERVFALPDQVVNQRTADQNQHQNGEHHNEAQEDGMGDTMFHT